jgi:Double zinc ribbon
MEINKVEAGLRADSDPASAASNDVTELELYDELMAFSVLPAEEQRFLTAQAGPGAAPVARPVAEPDHPSLLRLEEPLFEPEGDPISNHVPANTLPVARCDYEADVSTLPSLNASAEAAPSHDSFEPAQVEEVDNRSLRNGSNTGDLRLSNTGPLGDIWSGATIRAATTSSCPACGLQSEADDLFCFECGEFLDCDTITRLAAVCAECDSIIGNDDIFCPSCGSIVPAE